MIALALLAGLAAQDLVAKTEAKTPDQERAAFHLPPGFEIQLVAADPDIQKPMNIAFDERGRLWVTDTVEYPFPAPADRKPRDTVKILEDLDANGRARKITVFADGLNIPIGLLPFGNSAIVYSIPNIQRHTDTDGDGRADKHEVLLATYGSKDTHGMTSSFTRGIDGWIYACHGFANNSEVKAADGSTLKLNSGNVYRFRPDGSRVEPWSWGQVNPFGLCFDPEGNLFSADCHSRALYMLLRGAYYPSFGKPHDGLGYGPETCSHEHGSTGIAGVVYYAADHFPPAYHGTIFTGNPVTNRINHDQLEKRGSSFRAVHKPDFLKCDDPWFRPVDLKLGPDGALYVADFYNRIIGHYEVSLTHPGRDRERGRIWRIVHGKAAPPAGSPAEQLGHPNFAARILAAEQIVSHRLPVPEAAADPRQRFHRLWILERQGVLKDDDLEKATADPDGTVRIQALRMCAERAALVPALRAAIVRALGDPEASVLRAAADAAGRHPDPALILPLSAVQPVAGDAQLAHVIRMAIRNQLSSIPDLSRLMDDEKISRVLAAAAVGLAGPKSADFLLAHLRRYMEARESFIRYVQHIARHGSDETSLLSFLKSMPEDLAQAVPLVKALHQGLQERGAAPAAPTKDWMASVAERLLQSADAGQATAGADLAGELKISRLKDPLVLLARDRSRNEPPRRAAVSALVAIRATEVPMAILIDATEPTGLRQHVARIVSPLVHREPLLQALRAAPEAVQIHIAAGLAGTPEGAEALFKTVSEGKASARLFQEKMVLDRLKASGLKKGMERAAELTASLPPAEKKLADEIRRRIASFDPARADGDRGSKLFVMHCAPCHQIGGQGGKIAPQLDGVGIRGAERIFEDLIDPNRNVDAAFRTTVIKLQDGRILDGLVVREEGEVVILVGADAQEVRIPKASIEKRVQQNSSPMPANLPDRLPGADLSDLVAFLLGRR